MPFRIVALPYAPFAPLFALPAGDLAARRARRVVADAEGGYLCRVGLEDAAPGETLILVHHEHQPADTPFRAGHAIYVREAAVQARPASGQVPALLRSRLMSLRGFDGEGMMRDAAIAPGTDLEAAIEAMLADPAIVDLHLHYAKPGCYAARVDRC